MRNRPNTQQGGTTGVFAGSLKRKLQTIPLARLTTSESTTLGTTATFRLLLKNLFGVLNVHIAVGIEGTGANPVVRPSQYPAAGIAFGTVQLTPINNFPDANTKVYLRPVFQDPAQPINENHSLPEDLPFGWEGSTEADEVEIEVFLTAAGWINTGINGLIVCQVAIEYNGNWWDVEAIQFALSQVTIIGGPGTIPRIASQVE